MAHPKHKISKQRRNKRRTHYKATAPVVAVDQSTGEPHIFHHAHWHEDKLYYKGQVVMERGDLA